MVAVTKEFTVNEATGCYWHPMVETGLRCNRCRRHICTQCARRSPVGYKCPACVRNIQDKYFNGKWWDYLVAPLIAWPLSTLAAFFFTYLLGGIGWFSWFLSITTAPVVAGLIAESVRWTVRRRRSRYLAHVVAACLILAVIPFLLVPLPLMDFLSGVVGNLYGYGFIEPGILVFVGTGTIMARLR